MTRDRNEEGEQVILCQCEECNLNVNVDGTRGVKRLWSEHIQHTLDKGHTVSGERIFMKASMILTVGSLIKAPFLR